jgi:hypothetical protein
MANDSERDKKQSARKPAQGDDLGDLPANENEKDVKGGGARPIEPTPWPPEPDPRG